MLFSKQQSFSDNAIVYGQDMTEKGKQQSPCPIVKSNNCIKYFLKSFTALVGLSKLLENRDRRNHCMKSLGKKRKKKLPFNENAISNL